MRNRIFSTTSAKAIKAGDFGFINAIHYLAPYTLSGTNLCPHASPACAAACLGWTSGQAGMVKAIDNVAAQGNSVRQSRIDKARRFMTDRAGYLRDLVRSIELLVAKVDREGVRLCVRLNGSSDIAWEGIACERNGVRYRNLFEAFPDVAFVDYTKNPLRFNRALPINYHLTFSRSETNEAKAAELLARGVNVAVVFSKDRKADALVNGWHGFEAIDGDEHDLRQLDPRGPRGVVVALSPKGRKAARDMSGFVVR